MADEAAQDIQALNLRDRSEDTGREEVSRERGKNLAFNAQFPTSESLSFVKGL
jgi:hypothetical protein